MGGGVEPAREILDPLLARGVVILGDDPPIVVVSVDWCEIRNDAFDRWRSALAEAAGTDPGRVLVSSVHQHDAPVADLEAERILRASGVAASVCDPEFHERAVLRVAGALGDGLASARPLTHLGMGMARVDGVASNRRYLLPDGTPSFGRTSATKDEFARSQPEGTIDPMLRTLSFWDGDRHVAALHAYAVHPMSSYGSGQVSSDFVGLARARRQEDEPEVLQIYLSGCSGNVTAGKYNDGSPEARQRLIDRMERAMVASWESTRREPIEQARFRSVPLTLTPREGPGFSAEELTTRLADGPRDFDRCLAALGLSWRKRCEHGRPIDVPTVDLGPAQIVLLPGESYVEFQLLAQRLRPDQFVMALGYGECATGYVPTARAVAEEDTNLRDWCWVAPGAEEALSRTLAEALGASD
jgi:hypothetical protein